MGKSRKPFIIQPFPSALPRLDPAHIHTKDDPRVFVFGSNLLGIHGGGAARYAHDDLGYPWGQAMGLDPMLRAYGIPTCSRPGLPLSIDTVDELVRCFLAEAVENPKLTFFVSEVGCGLAGFRSEEIAPLFVEAPANCDLPPNWRR